MYSIFTTVPEAMSLPLDGPGYTDCSGIPSDTIANNSGADQRDTVLACLLSMLDLTHGRLVRHYSSSIVVSMPVHYARQHHQALVCWDYMAVKHFHSIFWTDILPTDTYIVLPFPRLTLQSPSRSRILRLINGPQKRLV